MGRMSLARTGSAKYRKYLRSQQWGFRRVRWFRSVRDRGFEPACQVCGVKLSDAGTLDLHHVSYEGVHFDETTEKWVSGEADEDLMSLCRKHHEAVHRMMDRGKEYYGWDRKRATVVIVAQLIHQHRKQQARARRKR